MTDAEDLMSFENLPRSANMTLLFRERFAPGLDSQKESDGIEGGEKFMLERISRVMLSSQYESSPTVLGTVFCFPQLTLGYGKLPRRACEYTGQTFSASPDAVAGSLRVTSTPLATRMVGSSTDA